MTNDGTREATPGAARVSEAERHAFGRSLHVDLYGVDRAVCDDVGFCYDLLDELTSRLGMNKQAPRSSSGLPGEIIRTRPGSAAGSL